jgi:hypothetical protein
VTCTPSCSSSVALVPPHNVGQQVVVLCRRGSGWRLPERVPLKQRTHDRVVAVQEQQVGEGYLPLGGAAMLELADDSTANILV